MTSTVALWLCLAWGPGTGEEGFRWPKIADVPVEEPVRTQDYDGELAAVERSRSGNMVLTVDASLHGRFSMPFGSANSDVFIYGNTFIIDNHVGWSEFFDPGWGATLTIDIGGRSTRRGVHGPAGFELGGYLSLQQQRFHGGSVHDDFGNSVKSSDLDVAGWMVGVKAGQPLGDGFYTDGRFGIGAVHYSEVMGDFKGPAFPEVRDVLFEETWTFAMELLGHAGIRLGPLGINVGMGFTLWVPPNEGSQLDLDSGPLYTWFFELGVELGF